MHKCQGEHARGACFGIARRAFFRFSVRSVELLITDCRRTTFRAPAGSVTGEIVVTSATTPCILSFSFSSCKYLTAPPTLPGHRQYVYIRKAQKPIGKCCRDQGEHGNEQINQPIQYGEKLVPPIVNDDSFERPATGARPPHLWVSVPTGRRLPNGHCILSSVPCHIPDTSHSHYLRDYSRIDGTGHGVGDASGVASRE